MARRQRPPKSSLESRQATNRLAAIIVPILLVGAVGYATWVVIVKICTNYLLHPSATSGTSARPGAAIAIVVIYVILLLLMATSYFRLIILTQINPGFTAVGPILPNLIRTFVEEPSVEINLPCFPDSEKKHPPSADRSEIAPGYFIHTLDHAAIFRGDIAPPPGMEAFYTRDVFQCDPNGLPIWCGTCRNWKPDRAHHCSDIGRCVRKLDHFCPWVGGTLGEMDYKFFVQFNVYTAIFTGFILIVAGVMLAEKKGTADVTWIIVEALAALFFLFTAGMAGTCFWHISMGMTTVDAIDHSKRTVFLAVKIRDGKAQGGSMNGTGGGERPKDLSVPWQGTIQYPFYTKGDTQAERPRENFAILCTPPGMNPWHLGAFGNWKSVMGERIWDWFLPLKMSPCCNHDRGDSMYTMGAGYYQMLVDAGIDQGPGEKSRRRSRRSSQRSQL